VINFYILICLQSWPVSCIHPLARDTHLIWTLSFFNLFAACAANCLNCGTNGAGKCNSDGCDATKVVGYDTTTQTCLGMLSSQIAVNQMRRL